jgi:type VI secretion system secreted protein Hcp
MAIDSFLLLDTVDGESVDHAHAGEIDILSWSFGANNTSTSAKSTGSGGGGVSVHDLTVTKRVDKASPVLFENCCTGAMVAKGKITVRKAGGEALEYLIVNMESVFITGYQVSGTDGQDQLTEQVTLTYKSVGITYAPQLDDGSGGPGSGKGWSLAKNTIWAPPGK